MKRAFRIRIAAGLVFCAALSGAACAQTPSASVMSVSFQSSGDSGFDAWRAGFAQRALAAGRDPQTVHRLLSGLTPDDRVITADRRQPEFTSAVWDYIERAVSAARIEGGRARRAEHGGLFAAIEDRYGVDSDIVAGIWAMETNFGSYPLPHDAARSLATLAFEGRRRAQFETYLLALIEMVERGYAGENELRSSWAGALGQPQFMPDMYLALAADWDGDGRRDIWNNTGDVIASISNYLAQRGWRRGEPVFDEVTLPGDFNYAVADTAMRGVSAWEDLGVRLRSGAAWDETRRSLSAQLFLPAGAQGPALLLYPNFQAIKRYNNSDRYALSVALLARAFEGETGRLAAQWPRQVGALNRDEILELQRLLNVQGFNAGVPDGQFGSNTRNAVRAFQQARGIPADGFPTDALLRQVRAAAPAAAVDVAEALAPVTMAPIADPPVAEYSAPQGRALNVAGVRELQRLLRRLGHNPGAADGSVGARTREAIAEFERSVGRRVTGAATQPVLNAARRAAARR